MIIEQLTAGPRGRSSGLGVRTDDAGRFELADGAPGSYRVIVRKGGYAEAETTVDVPPDGEAPPLQLTLEPTPPLELRLRTALGGSPDYPQVALLGPGGGLGSFLGTQRIDGDGTLALDTVPAGRWEIVVSAAAWAQVHATVEVPGEPVAVVLPLASQLLIDVPELADSDALATVRLHDARGRPYLQIQLRDAAEVLSIPAGHTVVSGLGAGEWTVEATAADGCTWSGRITLGEGERRRLVLE